MNSKNILLAVLVLCCALTFSSALLKLQDAPAANTVMIVALAFQWLCAIGFVALGLKKA